MGCGERVIAVSEAVKEYIISNYPKIDSAKIRMAYRGVDPKDFPRGYQPEQAWLDELHQTHPECIGKKIITLPGRMTRLKGHLQFLPVLKQLVDNDPSTVGVIVGGEDPKRKDYAQEVYAKVKELGLSDHVAFTGHRSDIRDFYAVSDVILSLSSKPESFGRTVLEPLAMGRPVVAWDHGGVSEILKELYPAGLVKLNDTNALLSTIEACLNSTPEIKENTKFLLSEMTAAEIAVYKEVVS
jgi:glycosyltransferase involved in cell wall biosynthesis